MKRRLFLIGSLFLLFALAALSLTPALVGAAPNATLKVVGLYSETTAGAVSYRVGNGEWRVIKLGDEIPTTAEIRIAVDRDWVELISAANPKAVYEIAGSESGEVRKQVADLLKEKPIKTVSFPKVSAEVDPQFANKLVVKEYLGRQRYSIGDRSRLVIKYGDILEVGGTVNIIGINNTLLLVLPNGKETTVVGPVSFKVEKILEGQNLYKYLNVQ